MDSTKVNRECLDKLMEFITKEKSKIMMEKVTVFVKENPNFQLNEAEKFIYLLSTTDNLIDALKLWKIKVDCNAMEREICEPLNALTTCIKQIKSSSELPLVFGVTLSVVNMIKGSNLKAIHVEDLSKIETTKDNTNSKYLLYHVVKKVLDIDPKFAGFPSSLIVSLEAMIEFDLNSLDTKIELMEKGCR